MNTYTDPFDALTAAQGYVLDLRSACSHVERMLDTAKQNLVQEEMLVAREREALLDAIRALRDVLGLDPERPCDPDVVAERSLDRMSHLLGHDLLVKGHTHNLTEGYDIYPELEDQA